MKIEDVEGYLNIGLAGVACVPSVVIQGFHGFIVDIAQFQEQNRLHFSNQNLLIQAVTSSSITTKYIQSYERLEFLGDSILKILATLHVYNLFPTDDEGHLTNKRVSLINNITLGKQTFLMGLDKLLLHNNTTLSRESKIYGDIFEALLAALFLEKGLKEGSKHPGCSCTLDVDGNFLHRFLFSSNAIDYEDHKGALQVHVQKLYVGIVPVYKTSNRNTVEVFVNGHLIGEGQTEKDAAKIALERCKNGTVKI